MAKSLDPVNFLNLTIVSSNVKNPVARILNSVQGDNKLTHSFHLVNSYTCQLFAGKTGLNPLIEERSINFPDGFWLAKYLRRKSRDPDFSQVRGPKLFQDFLASPEAPKIRHLFLGSTQETLNMLVDVVVRDVNHSIPRSNLLIVSPPFAPLDDRYMNWLQEFIRKERIQLIWVGMGTPKQDYLANTLTSMTGITTVAIGAAFDFLSGAKPESPDWLGKIGLEWLYRLATEPRRLWKRYLIGNLVFIWLILKDAVKR